MMTELNERELEMANGGVVPDIFIAAGNGNTPEKLGWNTRWDEEGYFWDI